MISERRRISAGSKSRDDAMHVDACQTQVLGTGTNISKAPNGKVSPKTSLSPEVDSIEDVSASYKPC